jgi:hypothetical protein
MFLKGILLLSSFIGVKFYRSALTKIDPTMPQPLDNLIDYTDTSLLQLIISRIVVIEDFIITSLQTAGVISFLSDIFFWNNQHFVVSGTFYYLGLINWLMFLYAKTLYKNKKK